MKISVRLRVISEFIPDNSFILDVGCDHALLDIYTIINKPSVRAIASDINDGPIKAASLNVEKYNLSDKIHVVLADGLDSYVKGVNTIVLSGLGSSSIVSILSNRCDVISNVDRLIISSNNDYYYLRKNICDLGFYILFEKIVFDRGKYYPIIVFEKGHRDYSYFEYKYGPVLLDEMDNLFVKYLKEIRSKLFDILKRLDDSSSRFYEISDEIKFIDGIVGD